MNIFKDRNEKQFFTLLSQQAQLGIDAANTFNQLTQDFDQASILIPKIKSIEHDADTVRHTLANQLDASFVTPLDKEDISALSELLDDIIDRIESASGRIALYEITDIRPDLKVLAGHLVEITTRLATSVEALGTQKGRDHIKDGFIKIHEIENICDQIFREALSTLFKQNANDPLYVIKWKEIYDRIERAVDTCETAAKIIESVVIKYA